MVRIKFNGSKLISGELLASLILHGSLCDSMCGYVDNR